MHAHWRNDRVLKWCNQQGIHVSAYGPLSSPVTVASMEKDVPNEMEVCERQPLRGACVAAHLPLCGMGVTPMHECTMYHAARSGSADRLRICDTTCQDVCRVPAVYFLSSQVVKSQL